jgi:hypothetical protein
MMMDGLASFKSHVCSEKAANMDVNDSLNKLYIYIYMYIYIPSYKWSVADIKGNQKTLTLDPVKTVGSRTNLKKKDIVSALW